jgi:hypothetical protein
VPVDGRRNRLLAVVEHLDVILDTRPRALEFAPLRYGRERADVLVRLLAFVGQAFDRDAVLDIVFGAWFGPHDELQELVLLNSDAFADREQIRFRFRGRNRDGPMFVEQQAYLAERDSMIGWMRIVCSGQRSTA